MGRIDIDSYTGVDAFGGRESTGGLQQAITDGEREPATEYLIGPGTYLYRRLNLHGSNLTFHARGRTRLIYQPAAVPPRGHGIVLLGGQQSAPQHDVTFEGLEMDGTSGYGADGGWDTTNKAVAQFGGANAYYERITFRGCNLHGWRGELIYGGGSSTGLGHVTIEDCELGDTSGDAISHSGAQKIRRNTIYRCNGNGIENTYDQGEQQIKDNDISDVDLDGIGVMTINATEPYGPSYVEDNRLKNCKRSAVTGLGTRNLWVRRNTATDCGWNDHGHGPYYFDVTSLWAGSTTRDLHVRDNDVVIDRQKIGRPLIVTGTIDGTPDVDQPRVWKTAYARTVA